MFLLLMRVRLQSAINSLRASLRLHPFWTVLLSLLGVGLFGGMFWLFVGLFYFATRLHALPEITYQVFYLLFLFLFAGSVPFIASTLLHSNDYSLLFHAPLRPRTIIASKLIDATVTSSLQFMVLGVPAIGASAFALHVSVLGWVLLPIVIAQFVLFPALLTSLGLLVLLQFLGMRRMRSAIAILNVLMALVVCVIFIIETQHIPLHPGVFAEHSTVMPTLIPKVPTSYLPHVMPSAWFVVLLNALVSPAKAWSSVLLYGSVITGINALLFLLCLRLGERNISSASIAEEGDGGGRVASTQATTGGSWYRVFALPVAGLIRKDLRYIQRDSILLSQMLMPTLLIVVPFLLTLRGGEMGGRDEFLPLSCSMVGIILFMQTSILSLSSMGLEGQAFWQYLTSPNSGKRLLWAKFVMSTLVSGGISGLLTLYTALFSRMEWFYIVCLPLLVLVCASGLCGLGGGISAVFPRFVYENPAHRVSTWALILGFFGSVGYLFVTMVIFVGAWLLTTVWEPRFVLTIWLVAGILHLALTLYIIFTALTIGAKRIERYSWET